MTRLAILIALFLLVTALAFAQPPSSCEPRPWGCQVVWGPSTPMSNLPARLLLVPGGLELRTCDLSNFGDREPWICAPGFCERCVGDTRSTVTLREWCVRLASLPLPAGAKEADRTPLLTECRRLVP